MEWRKEHFRFSREIIINRLWKPLTVKTCTWLAKQLQTCCNMDVRLTLIDPLLTIRKSYNDKCFSPCCTWKIPNSEVLGVRVGMVKWKDPFRSGRSNREKWSTDVWKLFQLDRTVPFSFRPKFNFRKFRLNGSRPLTQDFEIRVKRTLPWQCVPLFAPRRGYHPKWRCVGYYQNYSLFFSYPLVV